MKALRTFALGLALVPAALAAAASPRGDDPIRMAPFRVDSSVLNVAVRVVYETNGIAPPHAYAMFLGEVKPDSIAAQCGLKSNMEILAIQGTRIRGLTQGEISDLLVQSGQSAVDLLVKRGWFRHPILIRLPAPD